MKITSIPQLYRNANRWREILAVLSKYGLAGWLGRFELPFAGSLLKSPDGSALVSLSPEVRIRKAFEELGPTFIKLGQVLSTRPDLIGAELADELAGLQASAPADGFSWVQSVIEEDLGRPLAECFRRFNETPIASASIGQVHRAQLPTGEEVAVKVRHEKIAQHAHVDTDILLGLAELAEGLPEAKNYRPAAVATEFQRTLLRELDFSHERRRIQQFGGYFEESNSVQIPSVYGEHCSNRVLTLQWLEGLKVSDPAVQQQTQSQRQALARSGADAFLEMIFEHGVYHADPHPGNLIIMPDNRLGLIDFGMVGRLGDSLREDLEDIVSAAVSHDTEMVAAGVLRVSSTPADLDESAFTLDLGDFVDHYGNQPVGSFDLSGALHELISLIRRHQIVLPAPLAMLLKLMIMLEGTAQLLSPEFSLIEALTPLRSKIVRRRLSPARHARKLRRLFFEVEQLAEVLPRRLGSILQQVQSGRFDVHLDHRGLEPSVNRLVLGMLTSALFLGSSLMLTHSVLPIGFWPAVGVSAPGLAGCALSGILGLRLLRAISKSGRLERK